MSAVTPELARVKAILKHVSDTWSHVVRRHVYLSAMGTDERLRAAINFTFPGHVQNALRDVLIIDLIRSIGALILDTDPRSASVAVAITFLRDKKLHAELEAEYLVVPPLPPDAHDDGTPPEAREAVRAQLREHDLRRNIEVFATLVPTLDKIEREVINSDVSVAIKRARNKSVAHYDVVEDNDNWRVLKIDDSGLTFDQLDVQMQVCTEAIDTLSGLVRCAGFDFTATRNFAKKDVDQYIDALATGLRAQRVAQEERVRAKRQEYLRRIREHENP